MARNGVARRSGLGGDGDTPPGWLHNLVRDAELDRAQLWGNVLITDESARQAAEWLIQQHAFQQGYVLLLVMRYRPQYMGQLTRFYSGVSRVGRNAARRIRTSNPRSVIITRSGTIIG